MIYVTLIGICCLSMQNKTKLISKIIASTLLFLALAPQNRQFAQESPLLSVFLLRMTCVDTGLGNWARQTQDVSVGKAVYRSRLYMGPGDRSASMTCKLQPNPAEVIFQTLQLDFGMRDNDRNSPATVVNVYLDGVKAETRTVSPGQQASVSLDVTSTTNVSIETICTNQSRYCERVYFWNASLGYPPLVIE